jgi:hypothetical protein
MRNVLVVAALTLMGVNAAAQDIIKADYSEPTQPYRHGVLGDDIEWASLTVVTDEGKTLTYSIPDESVFEDISPRLADIDQDGNQEAWVIRADDIDGARLEAYAVENGALVRRYAGPAIGQGFRWLNPVGVADFDGDGAFEAAYVETPHIGGILTVLKPVGRKLDIVDRLHTYSTHSIGSTRLDLAAIADIDGDGAVDIILPNQVHDKLAVVSMRAGKLIERWRGEPIPYIGGGLTAETTDTGVEVKYTSQEGQPVTIKINRDQLTP